LFLIALSFSVFSQRNVKKVHLNYTESNRLTQKDCDTINYYVTFEDGFDSDSIRIFINDSLYVASCITTDPVVSIACNIKLPDDLNNKPFSLVINNSPKIDIRFLRNNHYVQIDFLRDFELFIEYTRYWPFYN
jgi:hypothetical protein